MHVCALSCVWFFATPSTVACQAPGRNSVAPVHGIFQTRLLEWAIIFFCRGPFQPRDQTRVSCISCTGSWIFFLPLHHLGSLKVPRLSLNFVLYFQQKNRIVHLPVIWLHRWTKNVFISFGGRTFTTHHGNVGNPMVRMVPRADQEETLTQMPPALDPLPWNILSAPWCQGPARTGSAVWANGAESGRDPLGS